MAGEMLPPIPKFTHALIPFTVFIGAKIRRGLVQPSAKVFENGDSIKV